MKKFLKWLIPCLVACFMVVGLVQTASFVSAEQQEEVIPDQDQTDVPVPAHTKSISGDEKNGYTLTLDVKGQKETIPGQKPKIDVVLVIDKSGSMTTNDMTGYNSRMAALKDIITRADGLSQTILGNKNLDAQMAIVTYSGTQQYGSDRENSDDTTPILPPSSNNDSPYDDASIIGEADNTIWVGNYNGSNFDENATKSINARVKSIRADGGTNCEAGLIKASDALLTSRPDAQKYVIFLSDGTPTFYYANGNDYYKVEQNVFYPEEPTSDIAEHNPNDNKSYIRYRYGDHVAYGTYITILGPQEGWYRIGETQEGWHYIEEDDEWKYGFYKQEPSNETYAKGITLGHGNADKASLEIPVPEAAPNNQSYLDSICSSRAYDAVLKLSGLTGFYTVGVSGSASSTFLTNLKDKSNAVDKNFFPGTNTTELTKAFSDIASSILDRSLTVSNVTITDTLSDYVELRSSGENGTVKDATIKITDASGKDVPSTEYSEANMVVKYDETTKTVTCNFNDGYSLKENYTYSVSFNVVPSQKAYTEYSKNNGSYGVDKDGNALTGFKSNGSAQLTYTYGDSESSETRTVSYDQKPEIQVSANQLTVTKVVEGKLANKNDEFTFNVDLINNSETLEGNYSFGSVEIKDKEGNNVSDSTISNQNGNITFKLKDGQTAYLTNLPRNYTFTLKEEPADGYDTTYSTQIVDTKNNAQSATFTYENKDKIFITVTNTAKDIAITGITDNTPKGLGLIGSIVVEIAAIAFVLKKKRQLKM